MLGLFTTKVVSIGAAVIVLMVGGWGAVQWTRLQQSQKVAAEMTAERDKAVASLTLALEVNVANQQAITQLQQEKIDIERSVAALASDKKKNQQAIRNLSAIIAAQAADPANQVKLSPVLKATVEAIQKQREARGAKP